MDANQQLLRHLLATLAYRTEKALHGAPDGFGSFRIADGVRTPAELVYHMTCVIGYAAGCFKSGSTQPEPLPALQQEVARFDATLHELAGHLESGAPPGGGVTLEQLLQGPLADALTHAGQIALLRRLAGSPIPPENFVAADIDARRLGSDRSGPADPDPLWPEAPRGPNAPQSRK